MKAKFIITVILLLAFILRFYKLGEVPISLEWDEVAIGYDAFSILKTGRDQFGQLLPLAFRSLDDWKPPIYEYVTVPAVAVFGLNEFSVRFPSALFGALTVLMTFFLAKILFSPAVGLVSAFLLAISPWHLQFSRATFEVNLSVFITVSAVTFFIAGIKKPKLFILSAVLFGLDLFSYHSTRVITPLLLLGLFIFYSKILPSRKIVISFLVIYALFFISFLPMVFSPEAQIRFTATNIFKPGARYLDEPDLEKIFLEKRIADKNAGFETAGKIFHNQRLIFTDYETLKKALSKYLSHFDFEFLFIKGDAPLHHAPGFGLLYIWELPFLIAGLIFLVFKGLNRYVLILPLWLLIAPLPTAVTREAPHAVRTELILPTIQIITAFGVSKIIAVFKKESSWIFLSAIFIGVTLLALNNSYYLHQYYAHTNYELSDKWLYGRKEAVDFTQANKEKYDRVLVSMNVDMPYIFWLFYTKYSPEKYLAEGGTVSGGFEDERNRFDKYEFRNFKYSELPPEENLLLVGTPKDFPPDARIIKTLYYLNGKEALKIAQNRQNP